MRSFHGIIALRSSHVGSKMNGTCPMINSDLHIIMPHTIHDDPLKCEGISELGQAQKPWKKQTAVNNVNKELKVNLKSKQTADFQIHSVNKQLTFDFMHVNKQLSKR